jgi:hypothetical protein
VITAAPLAPVTIIDAMRIHAANIPLTTPKVGGYATGTPDIRWDPELWARFGQSGQVRIDQAPGLGLPFGSDIKDIETDAATIEDWIAWARERMAAPHGPLFSPCYIAFDRLAQARLAADRAGLPRNKIGYGIADWNLNEQEATALLGNETVWVQWASPTSNPDTLVPGSTMTLAEARVDLGVAVPWWHPQPRPAWEQQVRQLSADLARNLAGDFKLARELADAIAVHVP